MIKSLVVYFSKPHRINMLVQKIQPYACILGTSLLSLGWIWGFFFTPQDHVQGYCARIMYVHVPCCFMGVTMYAMMSLCGLVALSTRFPALFLWPFLVAPVGLFYTVCGLLSGMIWGKLTWGTYWVWDGRLTSTLILAILYATYIHMVYLDRSSAISKIHIPGRSATILLVLGGANIPIIKGCVEWWSSLHQKSSSFTTMDSCFYVPLMCSCAGFFFLTLFWISRMLKKRFSSAQKTR
jgi:heme exporter protein C